MIVPDSQDSNFKQSNPGQFSLLVYADCSPLPPDYLTTCGFPQTLAPFIITSADRDASKSQIPPTEFQQVSKSVLHHREISIGPHIDRLYGRQMDTISGFTLYNGYGDYISFESMAVVEASAYRPISGNAIDCL